VAIGVMCQLSEAFKRQLGESFLAVSSITFSRGSVRVNSIIQLTQDPSDDDRDSVSNGVIDTFKRNGFLVDDISIKRSEGSTNTDLANCLYICFLSKFCI